MKIFILIWLNKSVENRIIVFTMSRCPWHTLHISCIIRITAYTDGRVLVYDGKRAAHNVTKRRRRQMGLVPHHWLRPTYGQISVNAFCCPPRACRPPQSHSDIEEILHSPQRAVHLGTYDFARGRIRARARGSWYNSGAEDFATDVVPTESYLLSESKTRYLG